MPKALVLDKVAVDLSQGYTQPAIQRLSSLVTAHPHDLDLRHRLARVYRSTGNTIEAGRWDYLNPDADPAEISAFERAHPTPLGRLRALRWEGPATLAPTAHARATLDTLASTVGDVPETSQYAAEPHWQHRLLTAAAITGVLGVIGLAVLGVITVVQWLS